MVTAAGLIGPAALAQGGPEILAAEILAAGATQHGLAALLASWPGPGPAPSAAYDTVGAQRDRVRAGARPAVVTLSEEAVAALRREGLVHGEAVPLGRTGVGLGARAGSSLPDVTDLESLRRVLAAAESVGWADPARGATAGRLFQAALDSMGLSLGPRGRLFSFGGEGVEAAGRGEVEVAVSQATELHGRPGVHFLGHLPEPFQAWTGYAAVAVTPGARADSILAVMASPAGQAAMRATGFS
ncbi:substrate-binding domain-containing protein [Muricoccus radiodurans]|uniref:substrate-binding domain-containing protein n=1 Tax=Muricoccus radiodurans TaxID=2231721 RepID=UPI003CF695F2